MKIRTKMILSFLVVSLASMIFISLFLYSNEKKVLIRQIFNHLESVASIQQNRIQAINRQNQDRLKLVTSRTQMRIALSAYLVDKNPDHLKKITQILTDACKSIADFKNIFIISLDGTVIASTNPEMIGVDMSEDAFFIRGKTGFSANSFFLGRDQQIMTYLAGPLFLNSQLLGVMAIESGAENMISSVSDYTGLYNTGETILARRLKNGDAQCIMPTRFDPGAALKLTVPKQWFEPSIKHSHIESSTMLYGITDYRGIPVLAVTRSIKALNWGVIVKIDQAEALAPIIGMHMIVAMLIAGATLLILLFSIYLAKNITRPITRLTWTARNISEGDYSVRADEYAKDETGILAKAFNKMTGKLINARSSLVDKIEALSESEERIRNLLNSTAEAICGLDKTGNCTFCNPAFLRMLGYPNSKELLGKNIHRLIHHTRPNGKEYQSEEYKTLQLPESQKPVHVDNEIFWRADGSKFYAEYWTYPVIRNDEITGAVLTFIDITERKRAESEREKLNAQLLQVQKMEAVGTLAGGIAHDFNNILSAMIGYAELARIKLDQAKLDGKEGLLKDVNEVVRAGERAKELVRQILTFSRGAREVRMPLEIHLIVKEALKLLRASIPVTIEIREKIDHKSGAVMADPTQIHQVLMNLCTNAYQSMRKTGGVLSVELSRIEVLREDMTGDKLELTPGPYLKLQITDTGCGMRRSVIDRIFDPYFTTKDKSEGTGMGLALTHSIVKNHDGHITVYSEPGEGTTFNVYLPAIVIDSTKSEENDTEVLPGGDESILVVDDENNIAVMEQRMLENLGYRVTATNSSLEAYQLFRTRPNDFDLVITDMTMPHMTGAELARRVLAIRPEIPIVLCTGFSELINESKARAIGIREYIMKPIINREIANVVRKVLDQN